MCIYIYIYSFMHICVQVVLNYIDRDVSTKPSTASFQLFAVYIYIYTDIYIYMHMNRITIHNMDTYKHQQPLDPFYSPNSVSTLSLRGSYGRCKGM